MHQHGHGTDNDREDEIPSADGVNSRHPAALARDNPQVQHGRNNKAKGGGADNSNNVIGQQVQGQDRRAKRAPPPQQNAVVAGGARRLR